MTGRIKAGLAMLWAFWNDYAQQVAEYQSWLWLGLCYYLVVGPTALVMFALRKPLLPSSFRREGSHWLKRSPVPRDLADMQRLY